MDKRENVTIRPAQIEDIHAIMNVEESAWVTEMRAGYEKWFSRISTFQQGTLVAIYSDEIMGVLSTEIISDYNFQQDSFTWYQITDNGFIKNTHSNKGKYLYGVDLSVTRGAPQSIASSLLIAAGDLVIKKGLKGILLGGRIPGYSRVAHTMTAQDYILSTHPSGKALDPEIYMYSKFGVRPIKAIKNYFKDPESLNYGVLLYWANPFCADTIEEANFTIKSATDLFMKLEKKYENEMGEIVCLHLEFPGAGCAWSKKTGGCIMCGFSGAAIEYSHGQIIRPELLKAMYTIARESVRTQHPKMVSVFNGGSFLNPDEIPPEFQAFMALMVNNDPDISTLFLETRAEYVTDQNLKGILPYMKNKKLVLGIGLETISEKVRNVILRKGLELDVYKKAIKIAHELGAFTRTYILLKPPSLTEKEAISEAVMTIQTAFEAGSDEVSVEACFISPNTILERMYNEGNYSPPSLWSIIDVLKKTVKLGTVYLGKFTDTPPPISVPRSCPICEPTLLSILDDYRNSLDINTLNVLPNCDCRFK
jgi:radical SAM enzyme (TIGR01210 family)